jgi:hypothetical protein
MKKLIALCAVSLALSLSARAEDTNTVRPWLPPGEVARLDRDAAAAAAGFSGEFTRTIVRESLAKFPDLQAGIDVNLEQARAELAILAKQSPGDLIAKLDSLNRGTSKGKYSRSIVAEALRRKGFEIVTTAAGSPPEVRRMAGTPAEAPAAK